MNSHLLYCCSFKIRALQMLLIKRCLKNLHRFSGRLKNISSRVWRCVSSSKKEDLNFPKPKSFGHGLFMSEGRLLRTRNKNKKMKFGSFSQSFSHTWSFLIWLTPYTNEDKPSWTSNFRANNAAAAVPRLVRGQLAKFSRSRHLCTIQTKN